MGRAVRTPVGALRRDWKSRPFKSADRIHSLDLEWLFQGEGVGGLGCEDDFSFVSFGALGKAAEKLLYCAFSFYLRSEAASGGCDRLIGVIDVDRGEAQN